MINHHFRTPLRILCLIEILVLPFKSYAGVPETSDKSSPPASLTLEELGARHGQALAASHICPGAQLTGKAQNLGISLNEQERVIFSEHSQKIQAEWEKAFNCTDVDPAQTREINGCRRAKILSCSMTWREIGPEGTAIRGLLEFKP